MPKLRNNKNRKVKEQVFFTVPCIAKAIKPINKAGDCPVCGMDLVPFEADISEEDKTYKKLLKKNH